jgi:hypothetical protein
MSRAIWVLCLFVAAVAGFAVGRHDPAADRRPALTLSPADAAFRRPVRVSHWTREQFPPSQIPERHELTPYRITMDGRRVFDPLDAQDKAGDIWQIDLADGRVIILAESRPAE